MSNHLPKFKLRLIVGATTVLVRGRPFKRDVLECGHVVRVITDFYGEIDAARRRCRWCVKDEPPHVEGVIVDGKLREYQLTDEMARRVMKAPADEQSVTAGKVEDRAVYAE